MERITVRRTFAIGNFESITIEAVAEHADANYARILASKKVLELAQQEMIRIFNVRPQNVNNNPWDQVHLELHGLQAELETA